MAFLNSDSELYCSRYDIMSATVVGKSTSAGCSNNNDNNMNVMEGRVCPNATTWNDNYLNAEAPYFTFGGKYDSCEFNIFAKVFVPGRNRSICIKGLCYVNYAGLYDIYDNDKCQKSY